MLGRRGLEVGGRPQVGPAVGRSHADPRVVAGDLVELPDVGGVADDVPCPAAGDPVDQVGGSGRPWWGHVYQHSALVVPSKFPQPTLVLR